MADSETSRFAPLLRLHECPFLVQYFANNLNTLFILGKSKKKLQHEWLSLQSALVEDPDPEQTARKSLLVKESTRHPHYVLHLSKRLFGETALAQSLARTNRKRLNIHSSEYVESSKRFISALKQSKLKDKAEGKLTCVPSFTCKVCSQTFVRPADPSPGCAYEMCKACAFLAVGKLLCHGDEGFRKEIEASSFCITSESE